MNQLSFLQVRNPKDDETGIEATAQLFSSLLPSHFPLRKYLFAKPKVYSFEIYLLNQTIFFYITAPTETETLIQSLLAAGYPKSLVKKTTDPLDIIYKQPNLTFGEMALNSYYYLPIKTYADFKMDPLISLIGYLAKQDPRVTMGVQMLITPASFAWQKKTVKAASAPAAAGTTEMPGKSLGLKKAGFQGGKTLVRLVVGSQDKDLNLSPFLSNLGGTFGTFAMAEGNQFSLKKPPFYKKEKFIEAMKNRTTSYFERKGQILNAQEMASLWHPPGALVKGVKNIAWGRTLAGEPPENLPVSEHMTEDEKKDINFFAKAEYKNQDQIFGIKNVDRRRHMYIMGKTGAGKSTLIANMAIDDIRRDRGIGVIDPHGDLCETILDYIPKRRLNDVIYLEPFDTERPFSLNVLEVHNNKQNRDLVASGIVAIFSKLYKDSWGPRLEYILRNVILTLLDLPDATLVDALNILSHEKFRTHAVAQLTDPVIIDFWVKEFDKMPDRMKAEAISPIQNKIGQFVQSRMIRNIIGQKKSSLSLEEVMDGGKILLLNLSQGKLGEDNAALLGAMIITQIQLAAMNRSFQKEEDRRDFFLYVDEFQNFATSSFIKILSEARKYRLALTLTNQYIEQLDEEIQRAIFGNVGTIISFVIGARDADVLSKEFGGLYTPAELVALGKFETVLKLSIDNMMSSPFPAKTLPLPSLKNDNKEKIVRLSKEKYGRKLTIDEQPLEIEEKKHEIPPDRENRLPPPPRNASHNNPAPRRFDDRQGPSRSSEQRSSYTPRPPSAQSHTHTQPNKENQQTSPNQAQPPHRSEDRPHPPRNPENRDRVAVPAQRTFTAVPPPAATTPPLPPKSGTSSTYYTAPTTLSSHQKPSSPSPMSSSARPPEHKTTQVNEKKSYEPMRQSSNSARPSSSHSSPQPHRGENHTKQNTQPLKPKTPQLSNPVSSPPKPPTLSGSFKINPPGNKN